MNREKYASFRITTYTLSRLVESALELLAIALELYSPYWRPGLLIKDAAMVHALLWLAVALTLLAPLPYWKLYIEFVVNNEDDYELEFAVQRDEQPVAVQAQRQHIHEMGHRRLHIGQMQGRMGGPCAAQIARNGKSVKKSGAKATYST